MGTMSGTMIGTVTRTMTRTTRLAALFFAASVAPVWAQDAGAGFPAEHPLLQGYEHVTTGDGESLLLASPMDMLVPYWGLEPTFEGEQGIELTLRREGEGEDAVAVVEMVKTGLLDDAVSAERFRGVSEPVSSPDGAGWFHGELGRQVKCRRSDDPNEWTMGPCP